jgi:hypothetical protein
MPVLGRDQPCRQLRVGATVKETVAWSWPLSCSWCKGELYQIAQEPTHGRRQRGCPGARAPTERFQGVLSTPELPLSPFKLLKIPHNYVSVNISRYSFGTRKNFCWMFILFHYTSRLRIFDE